MKKIRVWLVNIDVRMTQPVRFHVHFQYPELFSSSCGAFINAELLAWCLVVTGGFDKLGIGVLIPSIDQRILIKSSLNPVCDHLLKISLKAN